MLSGGVLMISAILIASYMKTWWSFLAFYSFVFPIGIGLVYWPPIIASWEWFPDRKGLISGLVIGAFGFGAFIFGFVTTAIANPDDIKPAAPADGSTKDKIFPESVAKKVPEMIRTCACCWAALVLISVCLVTRNPSFLKKEERRMREEKLRKQNEENLIG